MIALLAMQHGTVVGQALNAVNSPYPPSFDNNPMIFGWALFARLLVLLLSTSTLVRLRGRNIAERIAPNHPVYYHRAVTQCLLWGAGIGSLSDVLTYLFWGEVSIGITATVLLVSRILDGLTLFPFLMALFVPFWVKWLCDIGFLKIAPSMMLNGVVNDLRATWTSTEIPIRLSQQAAIAAFMITVGKYWLWLEHGRP
jgi:hypothetical protein